MHNPTYDDIDDGERCFRCGAYVTDYYATSTDGNELFLCDTCFRNHTQPKE